MKLDIHFRHMDRSESLEDIVTAKIDQVIEAVLHSHDAHIQVWLIADVGRENRGTGSFTCEAEVRLPQKKDFFLRKSDADMHVAINDAMLTLRTLLDEAGKKERGKNRRQQQQQPRVATES